MYRSVDIHFTLVGIITLYLPGHTWIGSFQGTLATCMVLKDKLLSIKYQSVLVFFYIKLYNNVELLDSVDFCENNSGNWTISVTY